jgi:hypothetical protein
MKSLQEIYPAVIHIGEGMQNGLSVIFQAIRNENIMHGHELILSQLSPSCTLLGWF